LDRGRVAANLQIGASSYTNNVDAIPNPLPDIIKNSNMIELAGVGVEKAFAVVKLVSVDISRCLR
jgi:hypothetical protein